MLPEEIADLSALLEDQEAENYYKLASAKPKKSKSKSSKSSTKVTSAASVDQSASHSVDDLIALETLRQENLAAELKLTEAKLELAKLSTSSSSATPPTCDAHLCKTEISNSYCSVFIVFFGDRANILTIIVGSFIRRGSGVWRSQCLRC